MRFTWNGRTLEARPGDSAAEALLRNGVRTLAASRKRHRPLGFSGSFVQGVLAEADGLPNVRLDRLPVREGLSLARQNAWPTPGFDLLKLFRLLPARWVRGGFEHPRWLPSGTRRFQLWERLLSFLAGEGRLSPDAPPVTVVPGRKLVADAVVVGGGPAGRQEAAALAAAGRRVLLITRGRPAEVAPGVELLAGHEVFGVYRGGRLLAAAPLDPAAGAVAVETAELVLATGRLSCPPLVPGNDLPGVMDARTALDLAAAGVPLGPLVVVGTGAEAAVAEQLEGAGQSIATVAPVGSLRRMHGRRAVRAIELDRRIACAGLVHAGPWIGDPGLAFQAGAEGKVRLAGRPLPPRVRRVGAAALPDEPVHLPDLEAARAASVCPCMDVTGAEILDLVAGGMTHVEELKRQTGCGMGPCQGLPCWELLRALLAKAGVAADDRPSHRPPRRAITVAQAAGLADLVEPQQ